MFSLLQCSKVLLPLIAATAMSLCDAAPIAAFGLPHTPLGNAHVDVQNGNVVVSNIGTGGGDGVLVAIPANTTRLQADISGISEAGTHVPGSYFQVAGIVRVDGMPDQVISTAKVTDLGSEWALDIDFSPVTSAPLQAQYLLDGTVIHEESVQGFFRWRLKRFPITFGPTGCPIPGLCEELKFDFEFGWQDTAMVTSPFGGEYAVDELRLVTTSLDSGFFIGYSGAAFTASGIPTFTITNEELTQVLPEPSSLALFVLALMTLVAVHCNARHAPSSALSSHRPRPFAMAKLGFSSAVPEARSSTSRDRFSTQLSGARLPARTPCIG